MLAQVTNDATLGRAFPQTLHAAWSVASGWKTASTKIAGGSDMQSVFVLADEVTKLKSSKGNKKPKPLSRDPLPGAQKPSANPAAETRTCRGCLVKGHILRDCPPKVMIAMGEDETTDTIDEDAYDSSAYITSDEASCKIFFTATEVLLDNQAGRSIFKNRDLLSDVGIVKPFYIGGIDGGSRGLCIREDGDFNDLGRVGLAT